MNLFNGSYLNTNSDVNCRPSVFSPAVRMHAGDCLRDTITAYLISACDEIKKVWFDCNSMWLGLRHGYTQNKKKHFQKLFVLCAPNT